MKQDDKLLGYIHQNAKMGTDTIGYMVKVTNDIPFRKVLESQLNDYQAIVDEAQSLCQQKGDQVAAVPEMTVNATRAMMKMSLLKDDSVQNMAKLLVKGSTNGVIEITQHLKECGEADKSAVYLANRLLKTEQSNIDRMKAYL